MFKLGWIQEEGKINETTYLLDAKFAGMSGEFASYLIVGSKIALIDAGDKRGAKILTRRLKTMNLIPDFLILTHAHWDHMGGTNFYKKEFPNLEVIASQFGIESLKNTKEFNKAFNASGLKPVENVTPVKQGDIIGSLGAYDDISSEKCHLHFAVIYGNMYLDPVQLLDIDYSRISGYLRLVYMERDLFIY